MKNTKLDSYLERGSNESEINSASGSGNPPSLPSRTKYLTTFAILLGNVTFVSINPLKKFLKLKKRLKIFVSFF